jgi:ribonuclease J
VKERRRLSFGGHIVISVCVDGRGSVVSGPDMSIEGLPQIEDDEDSVERLVRGIVNGTLKSIPPKRRSDPDVVDAAIQRAIRGEINAWWGKKPNVTVFVHRI